MTSHPDDLPASLPDASEAPGTDRCAAISLVDGEIVIYDTENHRAWIQSDDSVELPAMA